MASPKPNRLIESLPATIPFVAPEVLERRSGRPIKLRLGANESVFGISPRARQAILEAIDRIAWYADPESFLLREKLASFHQTRMENIIVGSGIDELLGLTARVFLEPGGTAVASLGAYPTFGYHVEGHGGLMCRVPYRGVWNDLAALADTAKRENAQIVYLANPDNPTGTCYSGKDLMQFLQMIPSHCLLLLDEAYIEYAPQRGLLPLSPDDPRLIRMRTFSKAYGMAGARIGYAVASQEKISAFDKVRLHFGVNTFAQVAATVSLDDQGFVASVTAAVAEGREDYYKLAGELGLQCVPSATNFVLLDIETPDRARLLLNCLLERGIFVRMPSVAPLDHYIRVTIGTPTERRKFASAMHRVARAGIVSQESLAKVRCIS